MSAKKTMPAPSPKSSAPAGILPESQQLFYQIFQSSPTAMVLSRLSDGCFVEVNQNFLTLTGYSLDEVIGLTSSQAGITSDPKAREERLAALKRDGCLPGFEVDVTRKSGEVRNGLSTVAIITITGEQFALSTFIDITERKRAEKQVVQMKRLYATLSQVNQTIVRCRSRDALFQSICDVAVQFGEFSLASIGLLDEASGEVHPVAAHGLDVAHWPFPAVNLHQGNMKDGLVATAIRTSSVVISENIQTDDRARVQRDRLQEFSYASFAAIPFRLNGNTIGCLNLVSREIGLFKAEEEMRLLEEMSLDISFALDMMETEAERKRAENILQQKDELLRMTSEIAKVGGWEFDAVTLQGTWTDEVARIHDLDPQEPTNVELGISFYTDHSRKAIELAIQQTLEQARPYDLELEMTTAKGAHKWVRTIGIPVLEVGKVVKVKGIFQDITERKQANERLHESEERYRGLFEHMAEGYAYCQMIYENGQPQDWVYVAVNETFEALTGLKDVIGKRVSQVIPGIRESDPQLFEIYSRVALTGQPEKIETFVAAMQMWFSVSIYCPKKEFFVAVFDVITERKQAEEKLQASERALKLFVEHAPAAIAMFDHEMKYLAASHRFFADYGVTGQNIIGRSHYEIFPEISERWKEIHRRCLAGAIEKMDEDPFPRADGGLDWVRWEIHPWVEQSGEIGGILLFSEVITERKRAEEALRESERQMRSLVNSLDDIVFEFDDQGTYLNVWTGDESLLTRPKSELFGRSIIEILGEENGRRFDDAVKRVLASGQSESIEYFLDVIGGQCWFLASISPVVIPGHPLRTVSMLIRNVTERKQAEEKIQEQFQHLSSLREIDTVISSSFDMQLSLNMIVSKAISELKVDAANVLVLNGGPMMIEYRASQGFHTKHPQAYELHLGKGIVGRCMRERKPIHIRDLRKSADEFVRKTLLTDEKFIGYYCVPLINKGEVKGVLEIFRRAQLDPGQEWIDFLHTLAGQAAIAIESASLFDGLQRSNLELGLAYDQTIEGWSHALDLRDKETEGHTLRVTELTIRLAQAFAFSRVELQHIRRGALLHDIGKLGVPDEILFKPGPLTDEEWVKMRKHPQFAYDLIAPIRYLKPALDIPYCHHEKWDGTGYPRGLKGEQIPQAARLFAVVDVWDALRNDRPYRAGWPEEKVLAHIRSLAGTHFDPNCVNAFLRVIGGNAQSPF